MFNIGDKVTYTLRPNYGEGIVVLLPTYADGNYGISFPVMIGILHNLAGNLSNQTGFWVSGEDLCSSRPPLTKQEKLLAKIAFLDTKPYRCKSVSLLKGI